MTWKRKYLKYKVEEEDFPQRLSMRRSAKYGNCNWTPSTWKHSSKLHMMYVKLDKFLKSRVGQSFDKVFSEFKSKFPDSYAGRNLVETFKNSFIEYQDRHWNGKYSSFYVENGIIKDGYKKPQKPKTVKINIRSKEVRYSFSDYVFKDKRLLDIITTYIPGNYYKYLIKGVDFSERVHDNIKHYLLKDNALKELTTLYSNQWYLNKGWYHCIDNQYKWTGSHYVKTGTVITAKGVELLVFNMNIIEDCDIVERKSKAFKRNIHDNLKTQKSIKRNKEKQKELERELLLHDLLQERKKKEKEENELIRDRHGFDDHSFKNW